MLALCGPLPLARAQTDYQTRHYGSPTGSPKTVVKTLKIGLDQTAAIAVVELAGGVPGTTAVVVAGLQPLQLPVLGATLLVNPIVYVWGTFDGSGKARLPLWPRTHAIGLNLLLSRLARMAVRSCCITVGRMSIRAASRANSRASIGCWDCANAEE